VPTLSRGGAELPEEELRDRLAEQLHAAAHRRKVMAPLFRRGDASDAFLLSTLALYTTGALKPFLRLLVHRRDAALKKLFFQAIGVPAMFQTESDYRLTISEKAVAGLTVVTGTHVMSQVLAGLASRMGLQVSLPLLEDTLRAEERSLEAQAAASTAASTKSRVVDHLNYASMEAECLALQGKCAYPCILSADPNATQPCEIDPALSYVHSKLRINKANELLLDKLYRRTRNQLNPSNP